jgi:hypothetical protein
MSDLPEPWLRGPIAGLNPALAPAIYVFQQTREDLAAHTRGLSATQVWAGPHGLAPLGFHLRHIAGSLDRLSTYLAGHPLNEAQMNALGAEMQPGAELDDLLEDVDRALSRASEVIRAIDPAIFGEARYVGRKHLPVTVIGLVVHIAEHTQRHLGQAISAAQLARAVSRSI